jgi:hypothetical protein
MLEGSVKEALGVNRERRTPRIAIELPIRVFATDFKGKDFVEDSTTVAINFHGARIRLGRELVPEQEIRILSGKTGREGVFRVVGRAGNSESKVSYWGVECLSTGQNIWGISFPELGPQDQTLVRAMLQCPACQVREVVFIDELLLGKVASNGGLLRGCLTCGKTGPWKQVPYYQT